MQTIAVVGLDLAKTVFQVHGVATDGTVVVRRQLRRGQVLAFFQSIGPCLIGIEACASAHHWARELMAIGHDVRLMPPAYVKAYVKRGKTDAADAEAIAEAVTRPTMRFVAVKSKAAGGVDAAQDPGSPGSSANDADQRTAGPPRGVRHRRASRSSWGAGSAEESA